MSDSAKAIPVRVQRFLLIRDAKLTLQEKGLLFVLSDYQGLHDFAKPGQDRLAQICGFRDTRQVRRLVQGLVDKGVLSTHYRHMKSCYYTINTAALADIQLVFRSKVKDDEAAPEQVSVGHGSPVNACPSDTEVRPVGHGSPSRRTRKSDDSVGHGSPTEPLLNRPKDRPLTPAAEEAGAGATCGGRGVVINNTINPCSPEGYGVIPNGIKTWEWTKQVTSEAEASLRYQVPAFSFQIKGTPETTSSKLSSLLMQVKTETGVQPTPEDIVAVIGSREFRKAHALSWGWLVHNQSAHDRFMSGLLKRSLVTGSIQEAESPSTSPEAKDGTPGVKGEPTGSHIAPDVLGWLISNHQKRRQKYLAFAAAQHDFDTDGLIAQWDIDNPSPVKS